MIFLSDTSIMVGAGFQRFLEICAEHGHQVEVPALIYAERVFQLRRKTGEKFDSGKFRAWFDNFSPTLSVQALNRESAENLAAALFVRFPDESAWRAAKCAAWRRCLGPHLIEDEKKNGKCGASVDLYILGLASPARPVVTKDDGPEWKGWPVGTVLCYEDALRRAELP